MRSSFSEAPAGHASDMLSPGAEEGKFPYDYIRKRKKEKKRRCASLRYLTKENAMGKPKFTRASRALICFKFHEDASPAGNCAPVGSIADVTAEPLWHFKFSTQQTRDSNGKRRYIFVNNDEKDVLFDTNGIIWSMSKLPERLFSLVFFVRYSFIGY